MRAQLAVTLSDAGFGAPSQPKKVANRVATMATLAVRSGSLKRSLAAPIPLNHAA
jgi:hypothetical protein